MKISLIIIAILFFYGAFATFFHDTALAGHIGQIVGNTNLHLFGYFAYINILILFYPLYKLYTDASARKNIDFYLGWILFFIAAVLFESLVLEMKNSGFIGNQIVLFLEPLIGKAGLWLLWLMIISLSVVFIVEDDFSFKDFFAKLKPKMPAKKAKKVEEVKTEKSSNSKGLWKKIFTNPFSSPALEDEMMPVLDDEMAPAVKRKPAAKKATMKKPVRKTASKKEASLLSSVEADEIIHEDDDAVLNEIEELEEKMLEAVTPKRKTATSKKTNSKNVEIVSELAENSKLLDEMEKGAVTKPKNFKLPKIDFLQKAPKATKKINEAEIDQKIDDLMMKLQQFKIDGEVVRTYSGPLVTTFEFKPAPNVKVSKILGLQDDLAMALSAETIRIQAPIPGRDVVGIEIPNANIDTIYLREILESDIFKNSKSNLTVALGKDIVGNPFVTDIKKAPTFTDSRYHRFR